VTVQVQRQEQREAGSLDQRSYLAEPAADASARSRMRLGAYQRRFELSMSTPDVVCSRRMHVDQEMKPELQYDWHLGHAKLQQNQHILFLNMMFCQHTLWRKVNCEAGLAQPQTQVRVLLFQLSVALSCS
jgi:hypothetical protein